MRCARGPRARTVNALIHLGLGHWDLCSTDSSPGSSEVSSSSFRRSGRGNDGREKPIGTKPRSQRPSFNEGRNKNVAYLASRINNLRRVARSCSREISASRSTEDG